MLNLSNARDYLISAVEGARVLEPQGFEYLGSADGVATITLAFTLPDFLEPCVMTIWVEGDALYGEW